MSNKQPLPIHQWTHDGKEVLIVKCVEKDGKSYGGFQWPLTVGEIVEAPDWNDKAECGGGLHGWPWGLGIGGGKDPDWQGTWLVFGVNPNEVIDLQGKVKAKKGIIRFVGKWYEATNFVLSGQIAYVQQNASGSASATGARGSASATGARGSASATGESGSASATGWSGSASATGESGSASATGARGSASATGARGSASATGESGSASATGWSGSASATGESGSASATGARGSASATGWSSSASATGASSAAIVTGIDGKAKAAAYSIIALAWWNDKKNRSEMKCAEIGRGDGKDKKLKANVWYELSKTGEFVEVKS